MCCHECHMMIYLSQLFIKYKYKYKTIYMLGYVHPNITMKTLHELCQTPPFKDAKVSNKTKLARFNWIHKWMSKWWVRKNIYLKII